MLQTVSIWIQLYSLYIYPFYATSQRIKHISRSQVSISLLLPLSEKPQGSSATRCNAQPVHITSETCFPKSFSMTLILTLFFGFSFCCVQFFFVLDLRDRACVCWVLANVEARSFGSRVRSGWEDREEWSPLRRRTVWCFTHSLCLSRVVVVELLTNLFLCLSEWIFSLTFDITCPNKTQKVLQ